MRRVRIRLETVHMKRLSPVVAAGILVLLSFGAMGSAPPSVYATGVCSAW